ncbi:MAG: diaminopimelate decarboxylase [Lachnospiraceae bacterium]|nr:diaminopimelate decarboxylase [Lachnospiraceae bacterium]
MKEFYNSLTFDGTDYQMQSVNLRDFSEKTATPFYIYDMNYIINKYERLKMCFPYESVRIFYAMKANYNPHILKIMKEHNFCLDTVSPAEVILAKKIGFDAKNILFTANNMTDAEMKTVKEQGVLFNIDSLYRLERFGKAYPGSEVCIRINPDVVAGENDKVATAGDLSKFGILLGDVQKAVAIAKEYDLKIVGVHEHTGSGIADTGKVFESMVNLLQIINPTDFPDLEFVDFGGGFKVPYEPDEKENDYEEFGAKAVELFRTHCERYGKALKLYFEPGKFTMADSACMVLQANTVKNNKGRLIVGTDSGFPHLIRPVLYGAYHHVVNLSNPQGEVKVYDIYGNTCESGDCFAMQRELPEIRPGDYLAIMNAGAYCRSMASEYNLRPLPAEYVIYDGEVITAKKKLSHEELAERILKDYGM